jgi:IclR family transcriptional regulator, acetate operon repressor
MSHIPAERCLSIIELLVEDAREMSLGDIAERLGLPKSGAHRLLATLVELGWVKQDSTTSFYRLSMRLTSLGQRYFVATGIPDICQPVLDRLAVQCGEFARLAVVDGDSLTWLAHAQGATVGLLYQPSLTTSSVPINVTASGKIWLTTLPIEKAIENALRVGFETRGRYGPNAVRSIEALQRELAATATLGYGVAIDEAEPGVTAIAAVIRSAKDSPAFGTVSVAGPSIRLNKARVQELAPVVIKTALELADLWPLRRRLTRVLPAKKLVDIA